MSSPPNNPPPVQNPNPQSQKSPSRAQRPSGVKMPTPPGYQRTISGPRSPSLGHGNKPLTPSAEPSPSGPLSPGSNLGQNAFIFPIRSVFQGINPEPGDDPNRPADRRTPPPSSLTRRGSQGHARSPSRQAERKFSQDSPSEFGLDDSDAGIQTIAQMLQHSASSSSAPRGQTATATFSGKVDRAGDRATSVGGNIAKEQMHGFFSVPANTDASDNPFFNGLRRASEGEDPTRPELRQDNSGQTVTQEKPRNDSADASGSGLTDPSRPPVAQPQQAPATSNFNDQPGKTTGDQQSYQARPQPQPTDTMRRVNPPPDQTTSVPEIKAPRPVRPVGGSTAGSSATSKHRGSSTALELDEDGGQALVGDFSGIIRLTEAGSLALGAGTATGTGTGTGRGGATGSGVDSTTGNVQRKPSRPDQPPSPGTSGPTGARLAQQGRTDKASNTRATVQNFVNEQAHTVNLPDPNAPTPSPTPHVIEKEIPIAPTPVEEPRLDWGDRSESSLSVRDSSEIATASGDDQVEESEVEEPIVTFRFEHVATDDGHHVVVGREGKLQRCEDEPITTPGAVQGFGVLIVLEEDLDSGLLSVRQASEVSTWCDAADSRTVPNSWASRRGISSASTALRVSSPTVKRISSGTISNTCLTPRLARDQSRMKDLKSSSSLALANRAVKMTRRPSLPLKLDVGANGFAGSLRTGPSSLHGTRRTKMAFLSIHLNSLSWSLSSSGTLSTR